MVTGRRRKQAWNSAGRESPAGRFYSSKARTNFASKSDSAKNYLAGTALPGTLGR